MPQTITGVDAFTSAITTVSAGDPAIAATIRANLQSLLNNTVAVNTDLSFQAADARGITKTITGPIVWNDGGGSVSLNLPFEVTQQSDLDVTHFHGDVVVLTGSNFQVNDDATFGNTGTDQFSVNAHADFYGETVFHNDVVVTTGDNLTAKGPVLFEGPTTTIQSPSNQIGLDDDSLTAVSGTLTVSLNAVVGGQLISLGNATLGNSSTDDHTVKGDITFQNDVQVDGELNVDDAATLNNGVEVHGTAELFSHLTVAGNTTLGNSSSDTITTNALLATPLGFTSAGRVPQRPTIGPDANTAISVTSTNLVTVGFGGLSASRTYTLSDGSVDGDEMLISTKDTAYLLVVALTTGADGASIQAAGPTSPAWLRYVWVSGSWKLVERGP